MAGDPDNASIWGDADVYVAGVDGVNPANIDLPFGGDWDIVGLLDGDAGFEESRKVDSSDFFAWGGLLIRTSRRHFKLTRKFTCLEENAVTLGLVWPNSGVGERIVPKTKRVKLGFETTDGANVKRVITRRYAEISDVGTIKDSEAELTKLEITVDIYPDSDGVLFDVQPDDDSVTLVSIAISPLTLALAAAGNQIKPLVVTATYSDASTLDITNVATYTDTVPAKATVDHGYVRAVAAGTTSIGASFKGIAAPAPCVVTVS